MNNTIKQEDVLQQAKTVLSILPNSQKGIEEIGIFDTYKPLHNKLTQVLGKTIDIVSTTRIKTNYLSQISKDLTTISNLTYFQADDLSYIKHQKLNWENNLKNTYTFYRDSINKFFSLIHFLEQINFLSNNVVAISANGSGKSSLFNILQEQLNVNGIAISAQRILNIPIIKSVKNPQETFEELRKTQTHNKTHKTNDSYSYLRDEYETVLDNLIAENVAANAEYVKDAESAIAKNEQISPPQKTNLKKSLTIWNSLIEHRTLTCDDGINIVVKTYDGIQYEPYKMSDGEKVMLFLIAQVLQAPQDGFIIIDEPEIFLHKAILKKLWDRLEKEREDCIFIYLTHDVDFATSRINSKKIWIKSYTHPDQWELEPLPTDELPETLLMELLGSRKKILFCEGVKGSLDEQIFNILYPELTISPVGSCSNVISYTKAFNKLANTHAKAYGLIDSDFHSVEEIASLKTDNIFTYNVAEIENLFLDDEFLKLLSIQLMKSETDVEKIKHEIINQLSKDVELQTSNYISSHITYLYTSSHVKKGNTVAEVTKNLTDFNSSIKIDEWKKEREAEINQVVANNDYSKAILLYNNKGLKGIANKVFSITDFTGYAMSLLIQKDEAKNALKKYFPIQLG